MAVERGNVSGQRDAVRAALARLLGGLFEFVGTHQVRQRQVETRFGQSQRDRLADAAPGAGNQRRRPVAGGRRAHADAPLRMSSRAMMLRWIWFVPSYICVIFASR